MLTTAAFVVRLYRNKNEKINYDSAESEKCALEENELKQAEMSTVLVWFIPTYEMDTVFSIAPLIALFTHNSYVMLRVFWWRKSNAKMAWWWDDEVKTTTSSSFSSFHFFSRPIAVLWNRMGVTMSIKFFSYLLLLLLKHPYQHRQAINSNFIFAILLTDDYLGDLLRCCNYNYCEWSLSHMPITQ